MCTTDGSHHPKPREGPRPEEAFELRNLMQKLRIKRITISMFGVDFIDYVHQSVETGEIPVGTIRIKQQFLLINFPCCFFE